MGYLNYLDFKNLSKKKREPRKDYRFKDRLEKWKGFLSTGSRGTVHKTLKGTGKVSSLKVPFIKASKGNKLGRKCGATQGKKKLKFAEKDGLKTGHIWLSVKEANC